MNVRFPKFCLFFCFALIFTCSFTLRSEVADSNGGSSSVAPAPNRSSANRSASTTTEIDFNQINEICKVATERSDCLMGGTIGFQYVRNINRMRQLMIDDKDEKLAGIKKLKKDAINFCTNGEGDESFILEGSTKASARSKTSLNFIFACTKIVELEIQKMMMELNLS